MGGEVIGVTPATGRFLRRFSIEATPRQLDKLPALGALLPRGTRVFLAHVDGTPFDDMLAGARRIARDGFDVVPHFPARSIADAATLAHMLDAYAGEAGAHQALALAGGAARQAGAFASSMDLLDTGLFEKAGVRWIGVAGHPEGNRDIGDAGIAAALAWKNHYAAQRTDADMAIVTQFAFEADAVIAWARDLRDQGNRLPIHIGVAGPAKLSTLIKYATMCGVGNSMRVLTKQARNVAKLMSVSGPDDFVNALAAAAAGDREFPIAQAHFFPLGGFGACVDWIAAARGGLEAQPALLADPPARKTSTGGRV